MYWVRKAKKLLSVEHYTRPGVPSGRKPHIQR
jgi:hypothetical protein